MWAKIREQLSKLDLSGNDLSARPPFTAIRHPALAGTINPDGDSDLDSGAPCTLCEGPARQMWVPGTEVHFRLTTLVDGQGVSLKQCPQCQRLWCYAVYEPLSAFSYSVRWYLTQADWHALHDHDDGATLRDWFDAALQALYGTLSAEEKQSVENYRQRAYYLTPFDKPLGRVPDLKSLLD